jgi:hypothetical protein
MGCSISRTWRCSKQSSKPLLKNNQFVPDGYTLATQPTCLSSLWNVLATITQIIKIFQINACQSHKRADLRIIIKQVNFICDPTQPSSQHHCAWSILGNYFLPSYPSDMCLRLEMLETTLLLHTFYPITYVWDTCKGISVICLIPTSS